MALTTNLVSYWKLDESSGNAADSVGSNTLTNNNTATYSSAKINNGISLNGSNQTLSIANGSQSGLGITTGSFTFSAWIKFSSLPGAEYCVLSKDLQSAGQQGYLWRIQSDGSLQIFYNDGANSSIFTTSGGSKFTSGDFNVWKHIAVTCTIATPTATIYIDGSAATQTTDSTGATSINSNTQAFVIGAREGGTGQYYSGMIDEVAVWSRALSGSEISELYNGGSGLQYPFSTVLSASDTTTITESVALALVTGIGLSVSDTTAITEVVTMAIIPVLGISVNDTVVMSELASSPYIYDLWRNQTKNTSSYSNQSKNSSIWTNQHKS